MRNEIMQEFLKNKKKIGILAMLVIVFITSGILYCKSGFKNLKKNDTENIFIEDENNQQEGILNEPMKKNSSSEYIDLKEKVIIVEIKGEVNKPDVYSLNENSIVKDLIDMAGGLTTNADLTNINRAKQLQNHELIYISNKDDIKQNESVNSCMQNTQNSSTGLININTASIDDLKTLNGIGDAKAKSIIGYREENGAFNSIDDIKNVDGIGEKMFEKIKSEITI